MPTFLNYKNQTSTVQCSRTLVRLSILLLNTYIQIYYLLIYLPMYSFIYFLPIYLFIGNTYDLPSASKNLATAYLYKYIQLY